MGRSMLSPSIDLALRNAGGQALRITSPDEFHLTVETSRQASVQACIRRPANASQTSDRPPL